MVGLRGGTLGNTIYMFGEWWAHSISATFLTFSAGGDEKEEGDHTDQVLQYDAEGGTWWGVGFMQDTRAYHALSPVDIADYCS